jgi:parvulin-like peptidyl-prolyl isomerase
MTSQDGVTVPLQIIPNEFGTIPKDKVLVQVNDVKITAGDIDSILKAYPDNARVYMMGPGRQQFIDTIVRALVLNDEGKRRGLDNDPTYKAQAQYSLAAILANQVNENIKKSVVVDDAALLKYFEDHHSEYEKIKARHILIRMKGSPVPVQPGQQDLTEEQALAKAKELQAKIKGGADFAELARAESDDTNSGVKGGELDPFGHGQMVPSFEEAAYKLKAGELSDPVKSPFGYHLILVETRQTKSFTELKPELEAKVRPELVKKQIDDLVNKAKVVLAPEILPSSKIAK